ncbi:MAG: hypothetical protein ABL886_07830 [Rhodoglobus sp.]
MKRSTKVIAITAGAVAIVLSGAGLAQGLGVDDNDPEETETAITGNALAQASAAALDYTGEGTVTGTEVGDEESYYEVEVTLDNGDQVDVQLDESFAVVDAHGDRETDD